MAEIKPSSIIAQLSWVQLSLVAVSILSIFAISSRLLGSPFRSIPGPLSGKLTSKWILLHGFATNRAKLTKKLHDKYGSVVQLGPKELSFNTATAINAIYGAGSIARKPASYSKFGRTGIFHMQDPEEHKERRRRMGDTYSMKAAIKAEPLIEKRIQMLLNVIDENLGKTLDTLHWNRMMIVDMASGIFWGESFGAMEGKSPPELMSCLDGAFLSWALRYYSPFLHSILTLIPLKNVQYLLNIDQFLYSAGANAVQEHIKKHGRDGEQETLIGKMLLGEPSKGLAPIADKDIAIEAANAIFAATETTSSTLAYIQFELAQNPVWQFHLRQELAEAKAKGELDFNTLNNLPILHGIVSEVLRLHPACAYAPRFLPDAVMIDGVNVPAGTTVAVPSTVSHFDKEAFPDPDAFKPQRWAHATQNMRDMIMGWTKGPRVCAGQNLAVMEMKMSTARIVERFTMRLASEQTIDDMIGVNIEEVMLPKGRKCRLIFESVDAKA